MLRIFLMITLVVLPACKKAGDTGGSDDKSRVSASRPADKVALPGDVIATLQLPSGTKSADLIQLIESVQPGASVLMTSQMPSLLGELVDVDLSNADLEGPVSIVLLNPEKHPEPALLLVKSSKEDALVKVAREGGKEAKAHKGLVLIGAPSAIAVAETFAFSNLAKPSPALVGTVYPRPLVKAYQVRFDEVLAQMGETMAGSAGEQGPFFAVIMELYKEMFMALGEQSERVVFSLGSDEGKAELFLRLYALPGTTVDAFIAAQEPGDYKLLDQLPADDQSTMLLAGEMRAGAARDAIFDFSLRATAALYDTGAGDEMKTAMLDWIEAFDGSFAASMRMELSGTVPTMNMSYLMGSSDVDRMRKGWRGLMTAFAANFDKKPNMMGMKFDVEFKPKAAEYDAVEVDAYSTSFDRSTMKPEVLAAMPLGTDQTMYIASFDDVAAMTVSTNGLSGMEALIAAARHKAKGFAATGSMLELVEASKRRKESMLMVFDMKELLQNAPQALPFRFMSMGMGKESDGALAWRISISR